jgi:hypothetical protein
MGFFSTLFGNDSAKAASQAAADTYAKQHQAADNLSNYAQTLPGLYNSVASSYDPYKSAGTSALSQLMSGLGLSGSDNQAAFTNAYRNLPGYQSGLETGQQAAMRGLNAGGGLRSGGALKALYRYGSNYEDQRAGDYLTRLGGLTGQGLNATNAATGLQSQGLGAQTSGIMRASDMLYGAAPTIGQGIVASQQAKNDGVNNIAKLAASIGGAVLGGPIGGSLMGSIGGSLGGSLGANLGSFFPSSTGSYGGVSYPIFGSSSTKGNAWF